MKWTKEHDKELVKEMLMERPFGVDNLNAKVLFERHTICEGALRNTQGKTQTKDAVRSEMKVG